MMRSFLFNSRYNLRSGRSIGLFQNFLQKRTYFSKNVEDFKRAFNSNDYKTFILIQKEVSNSIELLKQRSSTDIENQSYVKNLEKIKDIIDCYYIDDNYYRDSTLLHSPVFAFEDPLSVKDPEISNSDLKFIENWIVQQAAEAEKQISSNNFELHDNVTHNIYTSTLNTISGLFNRRAQFSNLTEAAALIDIVTDADENGSSYPIQFYNFNLDGKIIAAKTLYIRATFINILDRIKKELQNSNSSIPSCFFSYDWGNQFKTKIIHQLAKDYKNCGVNVFLDIWNNPVSTSIHEFSENISNANFVVICGTTEYKKKSTQQGTCSHIEMSKIQKKYEQEKESVIPIILEGSAEQCLPEFMQHTVYANFNWDHYKAFFEVLKILYKDNDLAGCIDRFANEFYRKRTFINNEIEDKDLLANLEKSLEMVRQKKEKMKREIDKEFSSLARLTNEGNKQLIEEKQKINAETSLSTLDTIHNHINFEKELELIRNKPQNYGIIKNSFFYEIIRETPSEEPNLLQKVKDKWVSLDDKAKTDVCLQCDKKYGYTLLHICAGYGYWSVYNYLVDQGFAPTANTKGFYPTHVAVGKNKLDFYKNVLRTRPTLKPIIINVNGAQFPWNELCIAILNNNISIVGTIFNTERINIGFNINEWGSLLHIAIIASTIENQVENIKLIELILNKGYRDITNIENMFMVTDREQRTILAAAAEQGKLWIVDYLYNLILRDVNIASDYGIIQDAFWRAAIKEQADVVRYFLSCGLLPNYSHPMYRVWNQPNRNLRIANLIDHAADQHYLHDKTPPNPETIPYENIVFQGGGMRGTIYPYAMEAFNRYTELRSEACRNEGGSEITANNLRSTCIKRVFGTSAGSSFALGVALKFDVDTLKNEMNKDFSELLSDNSLIDIVASDNTPTGKVKLALEKYNSDALKVIENLENLLSEYQNADNIYEKGRFLFNAATNFKKIKNGLVELATQVKEINASFDGYDDGKKLYSWLQELLTKNGFSKNLTFGELNELVRKNNAKHLYVAVTNLRTGTSMVISSEDNQYKDYRILDAVRASMSIPFVFKPHQLWIKAPDGRFVQLADNYVDGGVLYNYGIDYFDRKLYTDNSSPGDNLFPEFNPRTIGFRFKPHFHQLKDNPELKDYIIHFMAIYASAENLTNLFKNTEYHRSIELDTGNVGTLTFRKLTKEELKVLEENATKAVSSYFNRSTGATNDVNDATSNNGTGTGLIDNVVAHDDNKKDKKGEENKEEKPSLNTEKKQPQPPNSKWWMLGIFSSVGIAGLGYEKYRQQHNLQSIAPVNENEDQIENQPQKISENPYTFYQPKKLLVPDYECKNTLQGHTGSVNCIALLPNGNIISGSNDGTLKEWDINSGNCLKTFQGHSDSILSVAILPNNNIISGSADHTLKVWDINTGKCLKTLGCGLDMWYVGRVGWSLDRYKRITILSNGNVLTETCNNTFNIWDIDANKCLKTFYDSRCPMVLSNENVISGSQDATLKIWDINTGKCLKTLQGHNGTIRHVSVLPNGNVISGSEDTTLKIWDINTGKCLKTLQGHSGSVNYATALPNGNVISSAFDATLKIWDVSTGKCLKTLKQNNSSYCLVILPDGRIVSGEGDNFFGKDYINIWDINTGLLDQKLTEHNHWIQNLVLLPDGTFVSGSNDNTLKVWIDKNKLELEEKSIQSTLDYRLQ